MQVTIPSAVCRIEFRIWAAAVLRKLFSRKYRAPAACFELGNRQGKGDHGGANQHRRLRRKEGSAKSRLHLNVDRSATSCLEKCTLEVISKICICRGYAGMVYGTEAHLHTKTAYLGIWGSCEAFQRIKDTARTRKRRGCRDSALHEAWCCRPATLYSLDYRVTPSLPSMPAVASPKIRFSYPTATCMGIAMKCSQSGARAAAYSGLCALDVSSIVKGTL